MTDPAEVERLLGVIGAKNPRATRFIPIPRRPDGRLEPEALDAALRHGFCIVRWRLGEAGRLTVYERAGQDEGLLGWETLASNCERVADRSPTA